MAGITQSLWGRGAIAIGVGVIGAGAVAFSANTITTVTSGQLATGSAQVSGCSGSADVTWTPDPTFVATNDTEIAGGTLALTGDCIITGGASTVVVQDSLGAALDTAQVATAAATQTFTFASPVSTTDIENVTVTVRAAA